MNVRILFLSSSSSSLSLLGLCQFRMRNIWMISFIFIILFSGILFWHVCSLFVDMHFIFSWFFFLNVRMLWWTSSLKYACLNHSMTKWYSRKNKIPFGEFRAVFFFTFLYFQWNLDGNWGATYLSKLILMLQIRTYVCFIALAFKHTQFVWFYLLLFILWNCACVCVFACVANKKKLWDSQMQNHFNIICLPNQSHCVLCTHSWFNNIYLF